jgi:hypothetical protein
LFLKTNEYEILRNFGIAPQGSHKKRKKAGIFEKINFIFLSINNANSPTIFTDSKRALKELFNRYVFLGEKRYLNFT